MAISPKHSVSVAGIVVRDDGRVLVIRRDDSGHWEAPGGVLELDESFEDGVRREVLEETGLEVAVERLSGVYKNLTHGIVALVYRCRPAEGDTHPTSEAREVRWMTREASSVRDESCVRCACSGRVRPGCSLARSRRSQPRFGLLRRLKTILLSELGGSQAPAKPPPGSTNSYQRPRAPSPPLVGAIVGLLDRTSRGRLRRHYVMTRDDFATLDTLARQHRIAGMRKRSVMW